MWSSLPARPTWPPTPPWTARGVTPPSSTDTPPSSTTTTSSSTTHPTGRSSVSPSPWLPTTTPLSLPTPPSLPPSPSPPPRLPLSLPTPPPSCTEDSPTDTVSATVSAMPVSATPDTWAMAFINFCDFPRLAIYYRPRVDRDGLFLSLLFLCV